MKREYFCKDLWIKFDDDPDDSRHFENHDPHPSVRTGELADLRNGRARYKREPGESLISSMEELISKGDFKFLFDSNMEPDGLRFSLEKDFAEQFIRQNGFSEAGGATVYTADDGKQYLIEYINDVTPPMRGSFMIRTHYRYLKVKCLNPDTPFDFLHPPVDDDYGDEEEDDGYDSYYGFL